MFESQVNTENRDAMIAFLNNHFRYYTMNSWNRSTSYANNVKLYNLNLTKEQLDKAYEIIDLDFTELNFSISDEINNFYHETGYSAGFNGRSGGYIVLYESNTDDKNRICVYPGRSIDANEDFSEWDITELRERVKLVQRFDKLCDDIRSTFIYYIENCEITTVTRTVEDRIAVLKEEV